jgi:hypothetical protein
MEIPLFNFSTIQFFGLSRDHVKGSKVKAKEPTMKGRELVFHSSAIASKITCRSSKRTHVRKSWHHDIGVKRTVLSIGFDQKEAAKLLP